MRSSSLPSLLWRFKALRVRRGMHHSEVRLVQDEMYLLAQAITSLARPDLSFELAKARREFMALLEKHQPLITGCVMAPRQRDAYLQRWSDHQITPEISRSPIVTGLIVPRELSKRIVRLHKQQIALITDLLVKGA